MRKIIIILLIPIFTHAQKLDGAWGLKWGMSIDTAIKLIKDNKGYTSVIKKSDTLSDLIFKDVKWGFEISQVTRVRFYKDSLYSIVAIFFPLNPEGFFTTYQSLKKSITEKYFLPQFDDEKYKEPYTKDDPDSKKLHAIFTGYANVQCAWDFPLASKFENKGLIDLKITGDMGILLLYQDGIISDVVSKKINQKSISDF